MSRVLTNVRLAILAALALAAAWAGWQMVQVRQALVGLAETVEDLSPDERQAAERYLREHAELRRRLLAATAAGERRQQVGLDASAVRRELLRVLAAAARRDAAAVAVQLDRAEAALDSPADENRGGAWPAGAAGIAARVTRLEAAIRVGQELMTESHNAPSRLIARAAWHGREGQFADAAVLLDLAGSLLAVPAVSADAGEEIPSWFLELAEAPPPSADPAATQAAVKLAEAVALAESPSPAVRVLIEKARRELDAGRIADAAWWAAAALSAMGIDGTDRTDPTDLSDLSHPSDPSDESPPP